MERKHEILKEGKKWTCTTENGVKELKNGDYLTIGFGEKDYMTKFENGFFLFGQKENTNEYLKREPIEGEMVFYYPNNK